MGRPRSSKLSVARILDQVSYPVVLIDPKRIIIYCNQASLSWLGLKTEEDLVGQRCDYHSEAGAHAASGLCPPLEAFYGQHVRANVVNHQHDSRSAQFVPLSGFMLNDADESDDTAIRQNVSTELAPASQPLGVLVFVDDRTSDTVSRAVAGSSSDVHQRIATIRKDFVDQFHIDRIVGSSVFAKRIRNQIQLACQGDHHICVAGPTGSGREHILRTIYYADDAHPAIPLVPLSCDLFDGELMQSTVESFVRNHAELQVEQSPALLLQEVDQLSLDGQAVLANFLADQNWNAQVLSTSRSSLIVLAERGEFRTDLANLLSTLTIEIPALEDRPEDIEDLAQAVLESINAKQDKQVSGFSKDAIEMLTSYAWPRNIDELCKVVQTAHGNCRGIYIETSHLPDSIHLAKQAAETSAPNVESIELDPFLESIEKELIERALNQARGNKTKAAKMLGLSRGRMLRRCEHFGISENSAD